MGSSDHQHEASRAASVNRNDHRLEPMESASDHQHETGLLAKALVRAVNSHRNEPMESSSDHQHEASRAASVNRNDHRLEPMESASDHQHEASRSAKALVRTVNSHRNEP